MKKEIGVNVLAEIDEDKKLTLEIDLNATHGTSKSGKSTTIATTSGNVKLPSGETIGLNVYRPRR